MSKADNQYEGGLFEYLVCKIHNKEKYNNIYAGIISEERYNLILEDAKHFCSFDIFPAQKAEWIGRKTSNADGDLLIGSSAIEIKYTSGGTGTYLNTSLENLTNYGFPSYRVYMEKYNIYTEIEKYLVVNRNNASPVDINTAKNFKNTHLDEYKYLQSIETPVRKKYVEDLFIYLQLHPEQLNKLIRDILSKTISNKQAPSMLCVYNYKTKKVLKYDKENILNKVYSKSFKNAGLSLVLDNIRIAIGWQNCGPLNNPTMRCFIK